MCPPLSLTSSFRRPNLIRIEVVDWRWLLPWIRGWGLACEVLAPQALREQLQQEVRALAQQYGWYVSSSPAAPEGPVDVFSTK
ncbi:MAG TPA: WYL domain-containing protein [Anaerolineae bacterium]|nr:WYL domain-containing protein [Anaerolineae bacterium]